MWYSSPYPQYRQQPPPPKPPSRSLPTQYDAEEEFRQQNQSRHPSTLYEQDLTAVPLSKPHRLHSPCIGLPWIDDLVVDNRIPPAFSKVSNLVDTHSPLEMATFELGATISSTNFSVKSQTPLEKVTCEEEANTSSTGIRIKSKWTSDNKIPSTSCLLMLLLLVNVLPSLIFAQISTTEYVTFVGGTDTVGAAPSNTQPNVFPGARVFQAGFYERSQKCYYTFGGYGAAPSPGLGNSNLTILHSIA